MTTFARLRSRLVGALPWLSILGTLGAAAALHFTDDRRAGLVGFAQAVPEAVGATELARVSGVLVAVGDEVAPGQLVATLDASVLDAEIAVAEADKARLEADLRAEQVLLERRFDTELEALEREALRQREEHTRARAEEQVLDGEIARVRKLVADRQAVLGDLTPLDVRRAAVAATATEKPRAMAVLAKHLGAAERRRQSVREASSALEAKLEADLVAAQRRIEGLRHRREGYVLRATRAGKVASIDKQAGEVAAAGDPIVRLVSARERVVVCVPERLAMSVHEGDAAKLWVRGQRATALAGRAVVVSPVVTELPARCWPTPQLPVWGREVTLALDAPVSLVPGEAFDVAIEPGRAAPALSAPAAPAGGGGAPAPDRAEPRPMSVPANLARRTAIEPSGLVARPAEGRYLVVSDDTGIKDTESDGVPWLLAMSPSGAIDPQPVVVSGVDRVNDLESITAGDAGEIYVLASQSHSKKGKRKPSRTALLRLVADGRNFRVDGEVHLAELLDASPGEAAAIGLPDGTAELDVEGMTLHDGALYFGVKAPRHASGDAMIWRASSPAALFARPAGKSPLAAAGLAPWARARLDVEVAGQPTPGGVADLVFLPDGTLVIAATPSTGDGVAGAIYRVDRPTGGVLAPRLVRRFASLKPEGVSPSLLAGHVTVVFDTGGAPPLLLDLPWAP